MTLFQHRFFGHTAENETWMFTWWASGTRDIDAAQAAAVVWLSDVWTSAPSGNGLADHLPTEVGADGVTTVQVTQATGLQTMRRDDSVNLDGVSTADPMPADVALVVSLRTAFANRSNRGRFYLPPPASNQVTGTGRVLADFITDVSATLAVAWGTYNDVNNSPVVYSRTARTINSVISYDIGNLYDTQRRRETKLLEVRTSTTMPS